MFSLFKKSSPIIAIGILCFAFFASFTFFRHVSATSILAGDLVKGSAPAVYYITTDGKRHAFPHEKIYFSWYQDFTSVKIISDTELASYALGGNVTYRPGIKMLKISSDPKVYVVDGPNILRWVTTEQAAIALYGSNWNQAVDDLSDAFFSDYSVGTDISSQASF